MAAPQLKALTPREQAEANALYRHLMILAHSGVRKTEVMIEHGGPGRVIRVSPIGRGVDIGFAPGGEGAMIIPSG